MRANHLVSLALVAAVVAGCSRDTPPVDVPAARPATAAPAEGARAEPVAPDATDGGLAGTSWHLVQIMSMDDATFVPDDPAKYTLTFGDDGSVRVKADCNLATGSWVSNLVGQLEFGALAATQAECGADSLHDRYMSQFPWVRSYVLQEGHLFLATMADGSIIEFEPAPAGP